MPTNPIAIEHLRVCNFRGFAEREFAFPGQFNVLIGDNAAGKTSALEALAVALDPCVYGATGQRMRPIRQEDVRRKTNRESGVVRLDPQYPCVVEGTLGGVAFRREVRKPKAESERNPYNLWKETRGVQAIVAESFARAGAGTGTERIPLAAYYGTARREGIKDSAAKAIPEGQETLYRTYAYRDVLDARIDPRLFAQWMTSQEFIRFQEGADLPQYAAVRAALVSIIEGAVDVRYRREVTAVAVEFDDGRVLPLSMLSDGQRGTLELVGDIAWRMVQLNPGLEGDVLKATPGVVLIDELDLHLHPNWQRRIVDDLRHTFPAVQFIATSHSPFIVQSLREGELISLDTIPVPKTSNLGVDDIAEGLMNVEPLVEDTAETLMGVDHAEVSARYLTMKSTARAFLEALEAADLTEHERYEAFQRRLAEDMAPYADNPAYQAFLEMKLAGKAGDRHAAR